MDKLKFALFAIISLAVVGVLGYWAVMTIDSGSEYVNSQKLADLQKKNDNLQKEVDDLTDKLAAADTAATVAVATSTPVVKEETPATATPKPVSKPTVSKYQSLINDLQKLIDAKVYMKLHSSGTRVGTVQTFLNIYNNTKNKIDNDYGDSTVKAVIAFQKAQGIGADGQTGPGTYQKMIDWLKAHD